MRLCVSIRRFDCVTRRGATTATMGTCASFCQESSVDLPMKKMFADSHGLPFHVLRIYDGDTLTIRWRPKSVRRQYSIIASCRLQGIDTPELRGSSPEEKTRAIAAKNELARVLSLGRWLVRVENLDKYGRPLVTIVPGDQAARNQLSPSSTSLNDHLVQAGHAVIYDGRNKKRAWANRNKHA